MREADAIYAGVAAFVVALALTPLAGRFARAVGAVDHPKERGLSDRPDVPVLGGLAILAGVLVATLWLLDPSPIVSDRVHGIFAGATVIALVGALDDRFDLPWFVKLVGQVAAAIIPVASGVEVQNITLPFLGALDLHGLGGPITVLGLVLVMNVVNLSDGVDGLAAGVCAIAALAFAVIAFDLERAYAGILAAITAGAALGFLVHNFPPASSFMGDCGANTLGLLLGCVAVEGAVKTQALLALVFPLIVLAVPFVDTTFVVLKRLKYGQRPWRADAEHFHHRFSRIGFSQRRTVLYLYAWTLLLAGFAIALRFVQYSDSDGHLRLGGSILMGTLALLVLAASIYLVYVLEILKVRRLAIRRRGPAASEAQITDDVERVLETGEFQALSEPGPPS